MPRAKRSRGHRQNAKATGERHTDGAAAAWRKPVVSAKLRCSASGKANGLKPHLIRTFKLSNDPHFLEKLDDVVGLYEPPERSDCSASTKSQIQR
ncbi:MAG: hypothetical protein R3F40_09205 [Candidatus Competibacteraceae bacterium]